MLKTITCSFLVAFFVIPLFLPSPTLSMDPAVEKTIDHLVEFVEQSNCTFIRNDEEHDAKNAAAHMRKKYDYFKDKIDTPEKFIELCATRSLLSGRPYMVRCKGDRKIPTADWLQTELDDYRNKMLSANSAN